MKENEEEVMELSHDSVPGYRPVFYVVFAVTIIYLAVVLIYGGGGDIHGLGPTGGAAH